MTDANSALPDCGDFMKRCLAQSLGMSASEKFRTVTNDTDLPQPSILIARKRPLLNTYPRLAVDAE